MLFTEIHELKKDEYLYQSGDLGKGFYFVMQGTLDLLVKQGGEYKFSK